MTDDQIAAQVKNLTDEHVSASRTEAAAAITALQADRDAWKARAEAAEECLDAAEKDNRISDNGNMWRFWADKAREVATKNGKLKARAEAAEARVAEWRNDFRALEAAIVGDTGLSAMLVATQARLFKPRAESAEENVGILRASREALETQVAQLQRELAKGVGR